jgi:hypothetical protein
MRVLVQRVSRASVSVDGVARAAIGNGLLVLLGVTHDDNEFICDRLADKVRALRIFADGDGRMNEPTGPPTRRPPAPSRPSRSTSASARVWVRRAVPSASTWRSSSSTTGP